MRKPKRIIDFSKLCIQCGNIIPVLKWDNYARYMSKKHCCHKCTLIYRNTHVSPEKASAMAVKGYATRRILLAEGKLQVYKHSEETKQRLSVAKKIVCNTPEFKAKISALPHNTPGTPEYEQLCRRVSATRLLKHFVHPPEVIAKHVEYMKKYWAEHPHPMTGYKFTEEQINHHRMQMIGKMAGEKHHNWKGGVSLEEYGSGWTHGRRRFVMDRDNHRCQLCFIEFPNPKYRHNVHHIDFDKNHNTFDNLITLCNRCNCKVNYNRDFWIIHFQALMATDHMVEANKELPLFVKPTIKHAILN